MYIQRRLMTIWRQKILKVPYKKKCRHIFRWFFRFPFPVYFKIPFPVPSYSISSFIDSFSVFSIRTFLGSFSVSSSGSYQNPFPVPSIYSFLDSFPVLIKFLPIAISHFISSFFLHFTVSFQFLPVSFINVLLQSPTCFLVHFHSSFFIVHSITSFLWIAWGLTLGWHNIDIKRWPCPYRTHCPSIRRHGVLHMNNECNNSYYKAKVTKPTHE